MPILKKTPAETVCKMTQSCCWHDKNGKAFVLDSGEVYRLPSSRAKDLVKGGSAVELTGAALDAANGILALAEAVL